MSWEYKVLVLPASKYEVDEEILNIHGEKNWQLVSVLLDPEKHRVCYFQRPRLGIAEDVTREHTVGDIDKTHA